MKRKGLYGLAVAATVCMLAGCGTTADEGMENPQNQVTEAVAVTPEATATPAPTATPVPKTYMEENGIRVLGAGLQEYQGFKYRELDENGLPNMEVDTCEALFEVSEEDNGNGTKTIYATIYAYPYIYADGAWSVNSMTGFVDLQTGKSFLPYDTNVSQTTYLSRDDKKIEITLTAEVEVVSVTCPYNIARFTLVCPSDYEDAGFYLTGFKNTEALVERAGAWKVLDYINHGESELVVFGVKEGLATMPTNAVQEKAVRGVAESTDNYFEVNGLTTKGEGEVTYLGTEVTFEIKDGALVEESSVVETTTAEIEFRKTEEILEDGRKQIRGSFTLPKDIETEEFVKWATSLSGVVDKKTGLSYCPSVSMLAENVLLDRGGEEISMMIATEEKWTEDNRCILSYVVTCPKEYEDIAFYITGNYGDAALREKRKGHWLPISEVEHGESDMVFFQ